MTDRNAIIAAYEENEAAARRIVPGGFLLEEDCKMCLELAAEQCETTLAAVRAVMIDHWTNRF